MEKPRVPVQHSAEMAALHQKANVEIRKLQAMFPQYSRATIYRHARKPFGAEPPATVYKRRGRPRKLNPADEEQLVNALIELREAEGSFSSPRVATKAALTTVSNRTVRRDLNRLGYGYRTTRRKGMLTEDDFKKRVAFCQKIRQRSLNSEFWTKHIAFYLDGCGFQFKTNPFDQARALKSREWRKSSEGLIVTAKGKKEGATNSNFMVGISYDRGVVLCERYSGSITAEKMEAIVHKSFKSALRKSISPRGKRILMDGCPRQNSLRARKAYDSVDALIMKIPARSPDLNPIENFFNLVKNALRQQAIDDKITHETFEQYSERVTRTLLNYPVTVINKIIDSMPRRVELIIQSEGRRIKY